MICFKAIIPAIATDPSFVAGKDEREPRKPPIGVRATPTMQTSVTTLVYKNILTHIMMNQEEKSVLPLGLTESAV